RTPGTPAPIHIVTHGAGALVLIEALRMHPDLLERAGPVGRVVLLSPPLDGSGRPAALVEGVGELPVLLNLVDPATSPAGLAKVFGAYPSLQRLTRSTPTDGLLEEAVAVYGAAAPTPLVDAGGVRLTDAG